MFNAKKMGKKIKMLRGKKSQDEVAEKLNISRGSLSYYENGDRKPDADVLYAMSEYFGVPSDYIIGRPDVNSYDADLQAICVICEYTGLTQEAVEELHYMQANDLELISNFILLWKKHNLKAGV